MKKFITVKFPDGTEGVINVDHIRSIHQDFDNTPYQIHTDDTDFTISDETAKELMRDLTEEEDSTCILSHILTALRNIYDILRARLH